MALSGEVLGKRLQEARKAKGLTQEMLAERLEWTTAHVSKIERGVKNLSVTRLADICDAMDVDIGSIIGSANTPLNGEYNQQFGEIAKNCKPETVETMLNVCRQIKALEAELATDN